MSGERNMAGVVPIHVHEVVRAATVVDRASGILVI